MSLPDSAIHKTGYPLLELKEQVEKYDSISFWKSARGASVYLILLWLLIELVDSIQTNSAWLGMVVLAIIFLPLAFLFYKKYIWGMILTFAIWTALLWYVIYNSSSVGVFIFWVFSSATFYRSIIVEYYHRKLIHGDITIEDLLKPTPKPHWIATLTATLLGFMLIVILPIIVAVSLYEKINLPHNMGLIIYLLSIILSGRLIVLVYRKISQKLYREESLNAKL